MRDRRIQLGYRHHLLDQAPLQRLRRTEILAQQQHRARPAPTGQVRQQRSLDNRRDAEVDFGHAELRAVHRHPQIARCSQLQPGAQGDAVDARDHWRREAAHGLAAAVDLGDELPGAIGVQARHFADVGAADESPVTGAGEHQRMQFDIGRQLTQSGDKVLHQRAVQAVGATRVVDRHMANANAWGEGLETGVDFFGHGHHG